MRLVPIAIAASFLFLAPAAAPLRADPPPVPPAAQPVAAPAQATRAINIEARIVKATPRAARSLRLLGTVRRPGDEPTFDPCALERRLCCWQRAGQATTVSAPRLTVYPDQKATISMLAPVSYIQDFEVETGMGGASIANPVIGTLNEGLNLECSGSLAPRGVMLSTDLSWAELKRPIEELETTLADGGTTKVTIQLPEVRVRKVERRLFVAPGRAVLLADLPPVQGEGEHVFLVWMQARAIDIP